ncbi:Slp family lipoprotein [Paraglaciecola sp. 2405UD69-4]|uniref:Slp family lipoprotein n=1 Tax=Paraglaciecola sp. 2405UD69-4 TaxID=3391836 RepID=UPI0039C8FFC5
MNIRVSLLLLAMFVSGCATFPEELQIEDDSQLVSYQDASSKAEDVKGKTIRWGGAIAKIENKAESTVLEMVHYPLTSYGKPISGDESIGRYRVTVNGFMDPMVYQIGRLMTFTGELNGLEEGLVGEHNYVFPSVTALQHHLWKNIQRVNISTVSIWPHGFGFGFGYGRYNRGFYNRAVIRSSVNSNKGLRPSGAATLPRPVQVKSHKK